MTNRIAILVLLSALINPVAALPHNLRSTTAPALDPHGVTTGLGPHYDPFGLTKDWSDSDPAGFDRLRN